MVGRVLALIKEDDREVSVAAVQLVATAIENADGDCLRKLVQRFNVMGALFNALNRKRRSDFYLVVLHALWTLHKLRFEQACLEPQESADGARISNAGSLLKIEALTKHKKSMVRTAAIVCLKQMEASYEGMTGCY